MCLEDEYGVLRCIIVITMLVCTLGVGLATYSLVNSSDVLISGEQQLEQGIQEIRAREHQEEVILEQEEDISVSVDATVVVCTLLVCTAVIVLFVLWNWHRRRMAEISLAILQTPIERL